MGPWLVLLPFQVRTSLDLSFANADERQLGAKQRADVSSLLEFHGEEWTKLVAYYMENVVNRCRYLYNPLNLMSKRRIERRMA